MNKIKKLPLSIRIVTIFLVVIVLLVTAFYGLAFIWGKTHPPAGNIKYGITFSQLEAKHLNLDWKKAYLEILDDLQVRDLRLPSYWTVIEKAPGKYDFEETDFLVKEAGKRGARIILTVGVKQPRWPECHIPLWARQLSASERQQKVLDLVSVVVDRYKNEPSLYAWQVENEPFLYPFGDNCYPPDVNFLKREIALVKSLDSRPVIISDSGELTFWNKQMALSDIFGTTLYRTVWNPVTRYFRYPLTPGFYSLKSDFFRSIFAPNNQKTIIVELQSEPWIPSNNPVNTALSKQIEIFSVSEMKETVEFANETGFDEIYLWGAEWWYFMKEQGQPQYWDYARELFNG
ncbi:MAG TPA: beta-galactosidase [Patescibacteria group bacterium]|nr:beta-galactosidase [Patescibacteria group bacterium]